MAILSLLLAASMATSASAVNVNFWSKRDDTCNGNLLRYANTAYCCPGVILNDDDDDDNQINDNDSTANAYCCVGGNFATPSYTSAIGAVVPSVLAGLSAFSDCYPSCKLGVTSATNTAASAPAATSAPVCLSTIPLTASDYSSLVNAAGSSAGYRATAVNLDTLSVKSSPTTTTTTQHHTTTAARTSANAQLSSGTGTTAASTISATTGGVVRVSNAPVMVGALAVSGGVLVAAL